MPSVDTLLPFAGISLLLALTPGPDNLFVLVQSARYGVRSGLATVLGLCTGLMAHTALVAAGLGAVLTASLTAFTILKALGAAYLAFLAWQAFRAPVGVTETSKLELHSVWQSYAKGVAMNLSNPKVIVFFLAFLPQFVTAERGQVTLQIAVLGLVFAVAALAVFAGIAWTAGAVGQTFMRSTSLQRCLNWFAGTVFLALAVKLAVTSRR
ncbi:LysE family translocator [Methylovorus mays]|uniref:LysE family translocator n=1 Tax=Methylovorus mays TaxID=184077 RepID=UPI001E35D89C|nr:LysE family translocator [Methylovorus mays]MCB5206801.1 LysE family translocator [Methylovorus mays]